MSTKIYNAWRMPIRVYSEKFLPALRLHIFSVAVKHAKIMLRGKTSINALSKVYQEMKEASESRHRGLFSCVDFSINVWFYKNRAYVIPYGEPVLFSKFKPPKGVEDYCYWNNSDHPDDVTRRQWVSRDKMWEKVCLSELVGWDSGRMVHEIINASTKHGLVEIGTRVLGVDKAWAAMCF